MNSSASPPASRRPRKLRSRILMLLRRVHLYIGLFLLPWVFLYGITGAMFNHHDLFPETTIQHIPAEQLAQSPLADFPSAAELAQQVVQAMRQAAPESTIEWDPSHPPQFSNPLMLQFQQDGLKHAVHFDPVDKSAALLSFPPDREAPERLLNEVDEVRIDPDPQQLAVQSVPAVLQHTGVDTSPATEPLGWTKLNFLATVDGQPARVTYVLRDGHLDVIRYTAQDGFTPRRFFLRLHSGHGRSPHWNARMLWSLFIDTMALAMVTWGVTGVLMWWQIKRTRIVGGVVILLSISTATAMYFSMMHFYATNQL